MDSLLRRRINTLDHTGRQKILPAIERLYQECKTMESDDFILNDDKRPSSSLIDKDKMSAEIIVAIVNEYHSCKKPINVIMEEKKLSCFDVIVALCEYVFKQQGTVSRLVDFTEAIRFMYVDQDSVIKFVDYLLKNPSADLTIIMGEFFCLPSLCMLWLTLIWIEIKNVKMADLFDCHWNKLDYKYISGEEFKILDGEIQTVLDDYIQECTAFNVGSLRSGQLDEYLLLTREVVEDRGKVLTDTLKNLKELEEIINNRPSLQVETMLSDSSDSEVTQENEEICVLMQKITSKWLATNLTHELLSREIVIEKMNFYFTKSNTFLEENKQQETFVMCKLIDRDGDSFTMQSIITGKQAHVKMCDLAMSHTPTVRCPEGTRVLALYKKNANDGYWLPGTVGVKPLMQNDFEYLIFFDNGIDSYVSPNNIRLMLVQPIDPTTQRFEPREAYTFIKNVSKRNFIRKYLQVFPDWPLIRLKKSENTMRVLTKRDGREESAFVLDVDRQMCLLRFPVQKIGPIAKTGKDCVVINCKAHEHIDDWVYRGNFDRFPTLLSSTEPNDRKSSARRIGRTRSRFEIALPEYDLSLQQKLENIGESSETTVQNRNIQTARKSSRRQVSEITKTINISSCNSDLITRRKLSNKIKFDELTPPDWSHLPYLQHKPCTSNCIRSVHPNLAMETYQPCSPYFAPLIFGWTRELRKAKTYGGRNDNNKTIVVYRAPCGMRFLRIKDIAKYLRITAEERLTIDFFSFDVNLRPTVIAKQLKDEWMLMDDFARGLEDVKIPVINAVDEEKVPSMTYRARRFADSSIIDGSVQPHYCSGCSCTDDCADANKCECQLLTISSNDRLSASLRVTRSKTYQYRSLSEKVISGIYECNDMCSCSKSLCYNRVVQQNIKIPLQLYMTAETGWGVRTLVDIPAGSFISTYSGRLLTDRMAELQGREVSDMYLAELDLHEVVEAEKQQQGIDLIDANYDEGIGTDDEQSVDGGNNKSQNPPVAKQEPEEISDIDEQLSTAAKSSNDKAKEFNFNSYFGDNALFIVDAQESGNIGRFLNHSCEPNVYVQMVMVDTHDLRLPWVAFFAETLVKAGEELRWNYGYSPNSVPGKVLICKCGSAHCQGRLL